MTEEDKSVELAARVAIALLRSTIAGTIKWEKIESQESHREKFYGGALDDGLDVYRCTEDYCPFVLAFAPTYSELRLILTPMLYLSSGYKGWMLYCHNPLAELHKAITTGSAHMPLTLPDVLKKLDPQGHEESLEDL